MGVLAVTHGLPSQHSVVLGKHGDFPLLVARAARCPGAGSGTAVQAVWVPAAPAVKTWPGTGWRQHLLTLHC